MTLSERMVEAAARAIAKACGYEWDLLSNLGRAGYLDLARAALTAALAVAEETGAGVFVVPAILTKQPHPDDMTESEIEDADWRYAYEQMVEAIRATLAGRVTL
jgi:hypothetical protein